MKQLYRLIVNSYSHAYSDSKFLNKALSPVRFFIRKIANILLPIVLSRLTLEKGHNQHCQKRVIVSLTSFPARMPILHLVISGLSCQSRMPDKIILWLSLEQFPNKIVPQELKNLENDVFEIRFVPDDLRSHKKYFYSFSEYKDDYVILIDDDIYYDTKLVERLVNAAELNNQAIICRHGSLLNYDSNNNILSFKDRIHIEAPIIDQNFFFGSGGGTLFVPSLMYKDCLHPELFQKLTPIADDIWLNAMGRLAGLTRVKIWGGLLLPVEIKNNETLCSINLEQNYNDVQMKNVTEWYMETIGIDPFKKN